jgi:hypothetical protein
MFVEKKELISCDTVHSKNVGGDLGSFSSGSWREQRETEGDYLFLKTPNRCSPLGGQREAGRRERVS